MLLTEEDFTVDVAGELEIQESDLEIPTKLCGYEVRPLLGEDETPVLMPFAGS